MTTKSKVLTLLLFIAVAFGAAFAQVPLKGSTVDANTGFTYQGTAPLNQTLCGNGTVFVPAANCSTPPVCDASGCYVKLSGGAIFAWGKVSVPATGNYYATATVTFPIAFTTSPVVTLSLAGTYTTDSTTPPTAQLSSPATTTGASVYMARTIVAGAGGGNFDAASTLSWFAIGY